MYEEKMNVFVPIDVDSLVEKADDGQGDGKKWYVRGFASTPDLDLQGEIVNPIGIGIDYFVKHG